MNDVLNDRKALSEYFRKRKYSKKEKELHNRAYTEGVNDFVKECEKRLTDMILQHQDRLDFASGLAVANRILDEVAEQLKDGETDENSN